MQGRGTFIEYYEEVINHLNNRNCTVWVSDLVGQGGSSRVLPSDDRKQHIYSFSTYVQHLREFIDNVVLTNGGQRVLLIGYSTGGNVILRYLQENPSKHISGAVLFSPLVDFSASWIAKTAGWIGGYIPYLKTQFAAGDHRDAMLRYVEERHGDHSDNSYTSCDQGSLEIISLTKTFPELTVGGPTFGWFSAAVESARVVRNNAAKITRPVLILSGGADDLVCVRASEELVKNVTFAPAKYRAFVSAKHELFREKRQIREEMWREVDSFCAAHLP